MCIVNFIESTKLVYPGESKFNSSFLLAESLASKVCYRMLFGILMYTSTKDVKFLSRIHSDMVDENYHRLKAAFGSLSNLVSYDLDKSQVTCQKIIQGRSEWQLIELAVKLIRAWAPEVVIDQCYLYDTLPFRVRSIVWIAILIEARLRADVAMRGLNVGGYRAIVRYGTFLNNTETLKGT
jgi:hypothetical protein